MTKKKVEFIIDRPDFIKDRKLIEVHPGIESIDAAELRLREAREAYLKQQRLLKGSEKDVLGALALQLSNPRKLEEPVREYHRAFVAWCKLIIPAFEIAHNQAAEKLEGNEGQFRKLAHTIESSPVKEDRDAASKQLKEIRRIEAEPRRIMAAALRGRNAVKTAFHFATGRPLAEANENEFARQMNPLRRAA